MSEQARRAGNLKEMNHAQFKAEMKKKERTLLEEAGLATNATATGDASNQNEIRVARPRLQLCTQFVYSEVGSFFSHVLPEDPEGESLAHQQNEELINKEVFDPQPPFDVDVLYSDLFRLLELLKPVTDGLASIGPLFAWSNPSASFILLFAFILICYYPWLFLVIIEGLTLRALVRGYYRRLAFDEHQRSLELSRARREAEARDSLQSKKQNNLLFRGVHNFKNILTGDDDDAPSAVNARSQGLFQRLNPLTTGSDGKALDAKDRSHMNGLVTHALNGMLITFGLRGSLAGYQMMLTGWCDMIEGLIKLVDWSDRETTKWITYGLAGLLVYSIFLPQKYLILLAGVYVLTMFTPPSKQLLSMILGLVQFLAIRRIRSTPIQPTSPRGAIIKRA